ncbi:hypothetical protein, partial [Ruminococcus callidus]|uniref:hypothetical protein n=1 Tax=Ruminococcus callidus TaxID=40519 RepID=UPI0023F72520
TPQSVLRTASSAQGTPYGCPFRGASLVKLHNLAQFKSTYFLKIDFHDDIYIGKCYVLFL